MCHRVAKILYLEANKVVGWLFTVKVLLPSVGRSRISPLRESAKNYLATQALFKTSIRSGTIRSAKINKIQ
jgi:hypothetical protein